MQANTQTHERALLLQHSRRPNDDHSKFENRFKKKPPTNQNLIPRGMFGVSLNLSVVVDFFDNHRMAVNGLN